jgi:hypothetical protein
VEVCLHLLQGVAGVVTAGGQEAAECPVHRSACGRAGRPAGTRYRRRVRNHMPDDVGWTAW